MRVLALAMLGSGCTGPAVTAGGLQGDDAPLNGGAVTCVDDAVLQALAVHLDELDAIVGLAFGHPGDREAVGFVAVPGVEDRVTYAAMVAPCSEPMLYDPSCPPGSAFCTQLECTGEGAGWIHHTWSPEPFEGAGFRYEKAATDVHWDHGEDTFSWRATSVGTGPGGVTWSLTAARGEVFPSGDAYGWSLVASFAALAGGEPARLEVLHLPDRTGEGRIVVDGLPVATIDGGLQVEPVAECGSVAAAAR